MFKRAITSLFVLALVAAMTAPVVGALPAPADEEQGRKVKTKVQPTYPDLARRMNLSGVVKISVTVNASGTVKSTKALGGNPVLIQAAVDALKMWRWEPGPESTEVVQFTFTGHD